MSSRRTVAGKSHDPETILRGLLDHHHVIAGKPRFDWYDDFAARRVIELPGNGEAGPEHDQRVVSGQIPPA